MSCVEELISQVKVVASLDGVIVNNALTFENGTLQLRGPLVRNTDIIGNFRLSLGVDSDKINTFSVRASSSISIGYSASGLAQIDLSPTGILVTDSTANAKGILGSADFSANYIDNSYIQKVYTDSRLLGKQVTAELAGPGSPQNGFVIAWDNTLTKFKLVANGSSTAGANTQVIFNSGGNLAGAINFTFVTDTLSVPNINLGLVSIAGNRLIKALSSDADASIFIAPQGAGKIILGEATLSPTSYSIGVSGTESQIDINLEGKGTDSTIYIGSVSEAGGFRFIGVKSSVSDTGIIISGKGTGSVVLNSVNINLGYTTLTGTSRFILPLGTEGTIHTYIGGKGITSELRIGSEAEAASSRTIIPASSSANANLIILGKGTGGVFINGLATKIVTIPSWNMDSTSTVTVQHGIGSGKVKIKAVYTKILADTGTPYNIEYQGGGGTWWDDALLHPTRTESGFFDHIDFDATGSSRGEIVIVYSI